MGSTMDMFKDFDHYATPLGPDGTPYAYYEKLRDWAIEEGRELGWSEHHGGFWVVIGYDAVKEVLANTEAFSASVLTIPPYASPGGRPLMVAQYDEPQHSRYRKLVAGPFSPKSMSLITEDLRRTTSDLINQFIENDRADIVEGLANELPARAISLMMGLPADEGDIYRTWTHAMTHLPHSDPEAAARHLADMVQYFNTVIAERVERPGEDLLSAIVHADIDGHPLTETELLDFCIVFLIGGLDNTTKLIGDILWRLSWDRELRRRLEARSDLIPTAVDEALRYYSPAPTVRITSERVNLRGIDIEMGQRLFLALPIANRDPRQFPNPDVFIPDRTPNRHLALSTGLHRCLGAHLARLEAQVATEEVLRRIPDFELDHSRSAEWLVGQVGGMVSVPITFEPGSRESLGPLLGQR